MITELRLNRRPRPDRPPAVVGRADAAQQRRDPAQRRGTLARGGTRAGAVVAAPSGGSGSVTCARVKPSGCRSPGQCSPRHPASATFPPYSGRPAQRLEAVRQSGVTSRCTAGSLTASSASCVGLRRGGEHAPGAGSRQLVQSRQPRPVDVLKPEHRTRELPLRPPSRALEPNPPAELRRPSSGTKCAKSSRVPPALPENGPPAWMSGGSSENAPNSRSIASAACTSSAPGPGSSGGPGTSRAVAARNPRSSPAVRKRPAPLPPMTSSIRPATERRAPAPAARSAPPLTTSRRVTSAATGATYRSVPGSCPARRARPTICGVAARPAPKSRAGDVGSPAGRKMGVEHPT